MAGECCAVSRAGGRSRSWGVAAILAVWVSAGVAAGAPGVGGVAAGPAARLGAVTKVPADVSLFSASFRMGPRLERVWRSRAVQNLLQLPAAHMVRGQLGSNPEALRMIGTALSHPLTVEGWPILRDAVSSEAFVCGGADVVTFVKSLHAVIQEAQAVSFRADIAEQGEPEAMEVLEAVLPALEAVRSPSVLMGFKLSDPASASAFLDRWIGRIGDTPVGRFEKQEIAGGAFHVLRFDGSRLTDERLARLNDELADEGVPADQRRRLFAWMRGLRLTVAVGLMDGYLMLSIAEGEGLLARWGEGRSLYDADALAPLRVRASPDLIEIGYLSAAMGGLYAWTPESIREAAAAYIGSLEGILAPGLQQRLLRDADRLAGDFGTTVTKPTLSISFDRQGIESWRYGPSVAGVFDGGEPLSILRHRGGRPLAMAASHASEEGEVYETLAFWIERGYGYVETYALPEMEPEQRASFEAAMGYLAPFAAEIDAATRERLIPALRGAQSLVVIHGGGELSALPGGEPLAAPVPLPRLGVAVELNDAEAFRSAMGRYADAARRMLDAAGETDTGEFFAEIDGIPDPRSRPFAGGTLYFYGLPVRLDEDFLPGVLLTDEMLYAGTSPSLLEAMARPREMPRGSVVALHAPMGSMVEVDLRGGVGFLRGLTDAVFANAVQAAGARGEAPQQLGFIKLHVDALWRSLEAFRGYRSVTTVEGDRSVTHSWLHVEDIEP